MESDKATISKTNQDEIKCKECGAFLKFEPGTINLHCEFCGTNNEIVQMDKTVDELSLDDWINQAENENIEVHVVSCNSCGAIVNFDEHIVSEDCPFCGMHLVVETESQRQLIKPKSLLPFVVEQKAAKLAYSKWLKKLWWTPPGMKKMAKINERLIGMYLPFWTFDSNTSSNYTGQRGDDYTETETTTNSKGETETRTKTHTRWHNVSGNVKVLFDDVLISASNSLPKKKLDKLEPWDLSKLIPYDAKFLSGFRTETYQTNINQAWVEATVKMDAIIRSHIRKDIGGDHQRISTVNTSYSDKQFKHILLPAWISAYRFKDKTYRFIVNARTGEVQGERPYCWWKIALAILFGLALLSIIIYFVYYN
jgi:predicted RNA-binding Zn-ribbon protein involved in translation (DUF1610 family)